MKINLTRENLKNHWWYRLLKVVHVFIILFLLVIVAIWAWSEKPVLDEYRSTYQIKCDTDGVLRGNIEGSDLYHYGTLSFKNDSGAELTRFVCLNPSQSLDKEQFKIAYEQAQTNGTIPKNDNFEIVLKKPAYFGSWMLFSTVLIFGTLSVFLLAWIVQSVFFYILIGQKPQIPFRKKTKVDPLK